MITKLHELDKLYSDKITTFFIKEWNNIMANPERAKKSWVSFITPKYQQQYIAIFLKKYTGNIQELINCLEEKKYNRLIVLML